MKIHLSFLMVVILLGCNEKQKKTNNVAPAEKPTPAISYQYVASYPHDVTSFTEGFLFYNGKLFESTGATTELPQTRSLFGIVNLTTGKIDTKVEIDKVKYFGEGITILNGKIYQLTYRSKVGFVYDATTYKKLSEFTLPSDEGWGLTTDGTNLIMSDGTYELIYLDPATLQAIKRVPVTEKGTGIVNINELEYINGYIFANIWTTNTIIKINPSDGTVVGKLDLSSLSDDAKSINPGSLEMNGIAFNPTTGRVFITGKMWPKIYELQLGN